MSKQHRVFLTPGLRTELTRLIAAGTGSAQKLAHARILLKADEAPGGPAWSDTAIAEALEVSTRTIERVRARFDAAQPAVALERRPARNHKPRRFDGAGEARLIALACSTPPEGRDRWTLRLLASRTVEWLEGNAASYETVRRTLKKTISSPGSRSVG
jgi:transposase